MSGALAFDAAWLFAAFLVLIVLLAAGITARRYLLERGGGTVECGLRRPGGTWRLGVAAYEKDELRWYDAVGVFLTPEEVLPRHRQSSYPACASESANSEAGTLPETSTLEPEYRHRSD